jgi:hypothetical protein
MQVNRKIINQQASATSIKSNMSYVRLSIIDHPFIIEVDVRAILTLTAVIIQKYKRNYLLAATYSFIEHLLDRYAASL